MCATPSSINTSLSPHLPCSVFPYPHQLDMKSCRVDGRALPATPCQYSPYALSALSSLPVSPVCLSVLSAPLFPDGAITPPVSVATLLWPVASAMSKWLLSRPMSGVPSPGSWAGPFLRRSRLDSGTGGSPSWLATRSWSLDLGNAVCLPVGCSASWNVGTRIPYGGMAEPRQSSRVPTQYPQPRPQQPTAAQQAKWRHWALPLRRAPNGRQQDSVLGEQIASRLLSLLCCALFAVLVDRPGPRQLVIS